MRAGVIRLLVPLAVLLAVLLSAAILAVWKRPLAVDAWLSRISLRRAGLHRTRLDGPKGRLTLWTGGEGQALVLLHGAGDQAGAWSRVAPGLLADYRLVIPDLPGHGGSAPETGPLHISAIVEGIEAVMEAEVQDTGGAILIGNSLGAWVAMLYAVEHPDRVDRLVLVNGGALRGDHDRSLLMPEDRDRARALVKLLMGSSAPPVPGFVLDDIVRWSHHGPVGRLAATSAGMEAFVLDGRLERVTVPVDLLWGDEDGLMNLDYARRMMEGLPRARLTSIHGCGHVPQRECPEQFVNALDGILELPPPGMAGE